MTLDKLIRRFRHADKATRLDALLAASDKLPDPPARLSDRGDRNDYLVAECQTPVFLWLEADGGLFRIYAEVPRESSMVRGFLSLMIHTLGGQPLELAADLPVDLLNRMGLDETLGMMRTRGLSSIVGRLRRGAADLATH